MGPRVLVSLILTTSALLAVSAMTGAPGAFVDGPLPRGLRLLDAVVGLAVGPLGRVGGAIVFGGLGAALVWLAARPAPAPRQDRREDDEHAASMRAMFEVLSQRREPGPVAAWALRLRSPYAPGEGGTSWLGGLPKATAGFDWPRDPGGVPQTFLAQIDLAAVVGASGRGRGRVPLPERGALLVFFGEACTVRVLDEAAVAEAEVAHPPPDLPTLASRGYWVDGVTLGEWPMELVPFDSEDEDAADLVCPVGCRGWGAGVPLGHDGSAAARAWATLSSLFFGAPLARAARDLPGEMHAAIDAEVRRWRGHRLFGIEPDYSNNSEDLRGWSCLISVAGDPVLGTCLEHHNGLALWFRTEDLAAGRLEGGQVVWRCSV